MPKRVGIDWINNYHGRANDLKNRDNCARGFYNTIAAVKVYEFGDDSAWDTDFEQSGVGSPSSGSDVSYADNVDLAYFAGHGYLYFGVTGHDNGSASPSEMRLGDHGCRYLVCDSCSALEGDAIARWRNTFTGLRAIFGFHNEAHDEGDRGEIFADYLNGGHYMDNAWKWACQETESSDTEWGYLHVLAPTSSFNDKWNSSVTAIANPTAFCLHTGAC
ncbi:MAG TPA: DUF6345 domain-containing protein [Rhodocyclaceae bacterium]